MDVTWGVYGPPYELRGSPAVTDSPSGLNVRAVTDTSSLLRTTVVCQCLLHHFQHAAVAR